MAETLRANAPSEAERAFAVSSWYACYTRARHEKQVNQLLSGQGFETFLPLMPRLSRWKDREKMVEWPLFPSYVFGRFTKGDMSRVLNTPGVAGLVRSNGRPAPIPDDELENVRLLVNALSLGGAEPEPQPFLATGTWVEVMGGPFQGVRGVVVERRNRRRVLVGLKSIGQGLEIDIELSVLKPSEGP